MANEDTEVFGYTCVAGEPPLGPTNLPFYQTQAEAEEHNRTKHGGKGRVLALTWPSAGESK